MSNFNYPSVRIINCLRLEAVSFCVDANTCYSSTKEKCLFTSVEFHLTVIQFSQIYEFQLGP